MNLRYTVDPKFYRLTAEKQNRYFEKYRQRGRRLRNQWNELKYAHGHDLNYLQNIPEVDFFFLLGFGNFEVEDGWVCYVVVFE